MGRRRIPARIWRSIAAGGFWLLIAAALAVGGASGLLAAYIALAWLAVFSLLAWRRQDEFERAAQKFAWMFGGLFGLLVSLALVPVLLQPDVLGPLMAAATSVLGQPDQAMTPAAPGILVGVVWIVAGQLVGFLAAWFVWHLSKR